MEIKIKDKVLTLADEALPRYKEVYAHRMKAAKQELDELKAINKAIDDELKAKAKTKEKLHE
jgi:hypothetical protein